LAKEDVKTPAVKPCIVYIIVLLCSVGSKVSAAERFVGHPIGLIPHCWLTCEITQTPFCEGSCLHKMDSVKGAAFTKWIL
jgi:hypothetical protein